MNLTELFETSCKACDCNDPNCGLIISAVCHPDAGCRVKFFKSTRTIQIVCDECDKLVEEIECVQGEMQ